MKRLNLCFLSLFLFVTGIYAQWQPDESEKQLISKRMFEVVDFLSCDSLAGRESGTKEEIIARDFIADQFREIGLEPYYPEGYYKGFDFSSDATFSADSRIVLSGVSYLIDTDFYAVSFFGKTSLKSKIVHVGNGIVDAEHGIDDYSYFEVKDLNGYVFIIDISYPADYKFINQDNYYQYVQEMMYVAIQKGAAAIILYQSNENRLTFHPQTFLQNTRKSVPILLAGPALKKKISKGSDDQEIYIQIFSSRETQTGYNVAAKINNNSTSTVVIGAHYDHLGFGGPISRHIGPPRIHPGADDNASGVALVIELARFIKNADFKKHNYIFVAFGAEEKGLVGSKAFVDDTICRLNNVIAMINLDMVGRLDPTSRKLNVLGTGSSAKWDSLLNISYSAGIDMNRNPSGTGGSDQMAFYMKDIPVLFFITGIHKDYHTPSDVIEKINFNGMVDIAILVANIVCHLNNVTSMPYIQGEDKESLVDRSYTRGVTLGVIPDHTFGGKGMRIDDVFPGRNADLAGIKPGDIIVHIDDYEVSDLTSYMKALSNYRAGLKAMVKVIRGTEEHTMEVTF
jgi:aminopeptidase YwaD